MEVVHEAIVSSRRMVEALEHSIQSEREIEGGISNDQEKLLTKILSLKDNLRDVKIVFNEERISLWDFAETEFNFTSMIEKTLPMLDDDAVRS